MAHLFVCRSSVFGRCSPDYGSGSHCEIIEPLPRLLRFLNSYFPKHVHVFIFLKHSSLASQKPKP